MEASPTDDGWDALADGRWHDARAAFARAMAAGESARLQEGLSWAAWWLDDAEGVFAARRSAYRLYQRDGDPAGAARMAIWLAVDHLDFHGAVAVARGWLGRARRLLEPEAPSAEHGWLAFHEGFVASISGDASTARARAAEAVRLGQQFGVADLQMLGLALEGAMLVAGAEVEAGMRCLDEATATALAGDAQIPISSAWACCFLVSACSAVRDYPRAFAWCDRIAAFAQQYGSRYMLAFCRAEYGAVHLWRGRWEEAERLLQQAIEDFARSRPAWAAGPLVRLAELRQQQGHAEESQRLLDRAGSAPSAQLCRARLALDRGANRHAVDLCQRVLRRLPPERRVERTPVLEVLVRALVGCGDLPAADAAVTELRQTAQLVGTEPLHGSADVGAGLIAAAQAEHQRARVLFEDAVDRFERNDAPYAAAQARVELATTLVALDDLAAAQREALAASAQLTSLGADPERRRAQQLLDRLLTDRADQAAEADRAERPLGRVTAREREVLLHLSQGLTNAQIAEQLVVSEHTVHRHVTNILRKLGVSTRTAAAVYAARHGLLDGSRA